MSIKIYPNFVILCSLLFFSCEESFRPEELYGKYTPYDYKNNFDTIELDTGNIYRRKLYDKNNRLLLNMKGKWSLEYHNSYVQFAPFYLNLDQDLVKYPDGVGDTTGGWGGHLETKNDAVQFCVGYDSADLPDQNCYRKIGN